MKPSISQFNDQQGYRFRVLLRILLASLGGFCIANLTVPVVGLMFPEQLALAVYAGLQLSFVVWLVFILVIFSIKSVFHGFCLTLGCIAGLGLLAVLLKPWGTL
ncbi:hypothetical protein BEN74_06405 [Acinetobacter sp. WCHAc010034]|uniref:hypothetical protein n=1 Tax=Acinetobacter sp. WCHAc010034 TaxID=1879049 RepID=UPI00083A3034|nr:hypothetical protein [Acinetobacter sp. WCHAc010034]AYA02525.1 hypothetical protein BEN74_06405 [Acinetobacter sp. WCHAc010034]